MKKLFVIASILSLTACTNDEGLFDPNAGGSDTSIEGTWKLTSMTYETPVDMNGDGTLGTDLMVESNCYQNETLVFNANLTGQNVSSSYAEIYVNVNFPTDVTINSVDCVLEDETTNFAWLQNENTVTITDETGTFPATLNGNTLTIVIPDGYFFIDEEFNVLLTEDLTMVYTKQ